MKKRSFLTSLTFWAGFLILALISCSPTEQRSVSKTHTVEIKAMQFYPAEIKLQSGDTVAFINHDMMVHDITEGKTKSWHSQPLSPGDSFKRIITETTDYYCSLHPVMKGKLLVK
jgi:plastocyanin